jgi:hypothetical protein
LLTAKNTARTLSPAIAASVRGRTLPEWRFLHVSFISPISFPFRLVCADENDLGMNLSAFDWLALFLPTTNRLPRADRLNEEAVAPDRRRRGRGPGDRQPRGPRFAAPVPGPLRRQGGEPVLPQGPLRVHLLRQQPVHHAAGRANLDHGRAGAPEHAPAGPERPRLRQHCKGGEEPVRASGVEERGAVGAAAVRYDDCVAYMIHESTRKSVRLKAPVDLLILYDTMHFEVHVVCRLGAERLSISLPTTQR